MFTQVFHFYWDIIASQRRWFFVVTMIFLFGVIGGAVARGITPNLFEIFRDMFEGIIDDSFAFNIPTALKIFANNITAALLMIFGGMVFGIIPLLSILLNGFIIGYVIAELFFSFPMNIFKTGYFAFATIVPHGIFEIPAVLFSATLGIRFGTEWMKKSDTLKRGEIFRKNFFSAIFSLPLLIGILFVAAVIEVFISLQIGFSLTSGTIPLMGN